MKKSSLDLVAFGASLSAALVVLLVICALAAFVLPGWQIAHNWLTLFSAAEAGSFRNLVDGVVFSIIFGWITAAVLVPVYNRLIDR